MQSRSLGFKPREDIDPRPRVLLYILNLRQHFEEREYDVKLVIVAAVDERRATDGVLGMEHVARRRILRGGARGRKEREGEREQKRQGDGECRTIAIATSPACSKAERHSRR